MLTRSRILFAAVMALLLMPTFASAATYWHFTFTIARASDQSEREWAWATMIEIPKERAYPEEAAVIRRAGGRLEGTVFGLVRAAAWRAAFSETKTIDCGNISGPRGSREKFWHESDSESVHVHGGLQTGSNDDFTVIINARRVLRENGTWFEPRDQPHAFSGPIRGPGDPEIRLKGSYSVLGINYQDPNIYYRQKCPGEKERMWAKQFKSKLIQFGGSDSLRESLNMTRNSGFGQEYLSTSGDRYHLVWSAVRSNSSRHPGWKRREM